MQKKPPLRYLSASHAVYAEVKYGFKDKGVKLPPEWEPLVGMACFPGFIRDESLKAFKDSFARDPDLTLEILTEARRWFTKFRWDGKQRDETNTDKIKRFLLDMPSVVKEAGAYRLLEPMRSYYNRKAKRRGLVSPDEEKLRTGRIKLIPVAALTDGEIAAFLFGAANGDATAIVKSVRQKLGCVVITEKGKRLVLDLPKGKLPKAKGMTPPI